MEDPKRTEEKSSESAVNPPIHCAGTIGIVVSNFNDPFFGKVIQQIQTLAYEQEYALTLTGFLHSEPDDRDLQPLFDNPVDGLIVLGTDLIAKWLEKFQHLPVARIGHGSEHEKSVCITINEDYAANLLVNHLVESGKKKLLFIATDTHVHQLRCDAFERVAFERGVELDIRQSPEGDPYDIGVKMAAAVDISEIDALLCTNDKMAMGALHTLNERGIHVPKDLVVTGFDDIYGASRFIPSITTIQQPIAEMVATAVDVTIEKLSPAHINLPSRLVIRRSA